MRSCDVILIGYGPTSAILANLLGSYGRRVEVVERASNVYNLPRAVHFDAEIMRIFQRIGLAEPIAQETQAVRGMDLLSASNEVLARYVAPSGPNALGWSEGYMFHQPDLERLLREGVRRFPNVAVHLGTEVSAIDISDDQAIVHIQGPHGADVIRAPFAVGCCGARSITAGAMGTSFTDLGADRAWIVVDVELLREVELPNVTVQYCDPARPCTFVPSPGNLRRFELMLLPGEQAEDMLQVAQIQDMVSRWLQPNDYKIERAAVYTFHATLANQWRKGPLLIAGDAAHQMPPFLGQGLGSGARDAANLSWKLDLILQGVASPSLLDTYQAERSAHVRALMDADLWLSSVIQTTEPAVAQQRNMQMRNSPDGGALVPPNPPLGGDLCDRSASASRLPFIQPVLSNSLRHDDLLGDGFALLGPVQPGAWASKALEKLGTRLSPSPHALIVEWLQAHNASSVLVRPDRYVLALLNNADDLDNALKPLASHLLPLEVAP